MTTIAILIYFNCAGWFCTFDSGEIYHFATMDKCKEAMAVYQASRPTQHFACIDGVVARH